VSSAWSEDNLGPPYWWRVSAVDVTAPAELSANSLDLWTWTLGNLNHCHGGDIADLVYLVNYMFKEGPPPVPCP
jgi:hypothetical protein